MALTFDELDKLNLTAGEFDSLNLTCNQLDGMTYDKLLSLAKEKLNCFQADSPMPPERIKELKPLIEAILLNVASSAIYDAAKNVNWSDVLKKIIHLLS